MCDHIEIKNQNADDARAHIMLGKLGSLAYNPTEQYLQALRQDLYAWIGEVDKKLAEVHERQAEAERIEEEDGYLEA